MNFFQKYWLAILIINILVIILIIIKFKTKPEPKQLPNDHIELNNNKEFEKLEDNTKSQIQNNISSQKSILNVENLKEFNKLIKKIRLKKIPKKCINLLNDISRRNELGSNILNNKIIASIENQLKILIEKQNEKDKKSKYETFQSELSIGNISHNISKIIKYNDLKSDMTEDNVCRSESDLIKFRQSPNYSEIINVIKITNLDDINQLNEFFDKIEKIKSLKESLLKQIKKRNQLVSQKLLLKLKKILQERLVQCQKNLQNPYFNDLENDYPNNTIFAERLNLELILIKIDRYLLRTDKYLSDKEIYEEDITILQDLQKIQDQLSSDNKYTKKEIELKEYSNFLEEFETDAVFEVQKKKLMLTNVPLSKKTQDFFELVKKTTQQAADQDKTDFYNKFPSIPSNFGYNDIYDSIFKSDDTLETFIKDKIIKDNLLLKNHNFIRDIIADSDQKDILNLLKNEEILKILHNGRLKENKNL
ncbi:MAG: hypothetical protein AB3N34_00490 [Lettuce witches'-broom phytoplasma]